MLMLSRLSSQRFSLSLSSSSTGLRLCGSACIEDVSHNANES